MALFWLGLGSLVLPFTIPVFYRVGYSIWPPLMFFIGVGVAIWDWRRRSRMPAAANDPDGGAPSPPVTVAPVMRPRESPVGSSTPVTVAPATSGTKVCPDCAETVLAAARVCRFCRYEFPVSPVVADTIASLHDTPDSRFGPTPGATTPVPAATARAGLVGYVWLAVIAVVVLGIALLSQLHFAPSTPGHPGAAYFGDTAPVAAEPSPSMVCTREWFDSNGNLRHTDVPCGQSKPGPDRCYRVLKTYPATAAIYMADPRPGTYSSEEDLKYFAARSPGNCPDLN